MKLYIWNCSKAIDNYEVTSHQERSFELWGTEHARLFSISQQRICIIDHSLILLVLKKQKCVWSDARKRDWLDTLIRNWCAGKRVSSYCYVNRVDINISSMLRRSPSPRQYLSFRGWAGCHYTEFQKSHIKLWSCAKLFCHVIKQVNAQSYNFFIFLYRTKSYSCKHLLSAVIDRFIFLKNKSLKGYGFLHRGRCIIIPF